MDKRRITLTRYYSNKYHYGFWIVLFERTQSQLKMYERKFGAPSALRCARLLAQIAESEAKQ